MRYLRSSTGFLLGVGLLGASVEAVYARMATLSARFALRRGDREDGRDLASRREGRRRDPIRPDCGTNEPPKESSWDRFPPPPPRVAGDPDRAAGRIDVRGRRRSSTPARSGRGRRSGKASPRYSREISPRRPGSSGRIDASWRRSAGGGSPTRRRSRSTPGPRAPAFPAIGGWLGPCSSSSLRVRPLISVRSAT